MRADPNQVPRVGTKRRALGASPGTLVLRITRTGNALQNLAAARPWSGTRQLGSTAGAIWPKKRECLPFPFASAPRKRDDGHPRVFRISSRFCRERPSRCEVTGSGKPANTPRVLKSYGLSESGIARDCAPLRGHFGGDGGNADTKGSEPYSKDRTAQAPCFVTERADLAAQARRLTQHHTKNMGVVEPLAASPARRFDLAAWNGQPETFPVNEIKTTTTWFLLFDSFGLKRGPFRDAFRTRPP